MTSATTTTPQKHAADQAVRHVTRMTSPIGGIEIVSDGASIAGLSIESSDALPHDDRADGRTDERNEVLERAVVQLREYFEGTRRSFDLPVVLPGTDFQRAVWQQLLEVPWGEVTSYGAIGIATGRATAGRAVGGAVGANPIPIIVGCHRVLASGGRITGYSAGRGVPTKAWLLDHENIPHS